MRNIIEHLGLTVATIVLLLALVALGTDKTGTPPEVTFAGVTAEKNHLPHEMQLSNDSIRSTTRSTSNHAVTHAGAVRISISGSPRNEAQSVPVRTEERSAKPENHAEGRAIEARGEGGNTTGPASPVRIR